MMLVRAAQQRFGAGSRWVRWVDRPHVNLIFKRHANQAVFVRCDLELLALTTKGRNVFYRLVGFAAGDRESSVG
jgi:hypothetical protein